MKRLITVEGLLDVLGSQHCIYGDKEIKFRPKEVPTFDLIEREADTEDSSMLLGREEAFLGITSITDMISRLAKLELLGRSKSVIGYNSLEEVEWELYLDTEDGEVLVISSQECMHSPS